MFKSIPPHGSSSSMAPSAQDVTHIWIGWEYNSPTPQGRNRTRPNNLYLFPQPVRLIPPSYPLLFSRPPSDPHAAVQIQIWDRINTTRPNQTPLSPYLRSPFDSSHLPSPLLSFTLSGSGNPPSRRREKAVVRRDIYINVNG